MVRNITALLSAVVLSISMAVVGGSIAAPTSHAAPGASQYCSEHNNLGLSHGACVSLLESNGHSSAFFESFCKVYLLPHGYFDTVGQCVSTLNAIFKS